MYKWIWSRKHIRLVMNLTVYFHCKPYLNNKCTRQDSLKCILNHRILSIDSYNNKQSEFSIQFCNDKLKTQVN